MARPQKGLGARGRDLRKALAFAGALPTLIQSRYPKIVRRISGYNLDQLIPNERGEVNIARALVGSEATCVAIAEAKVTLIYNQPERVLLVLGYPDVYQAADHLMEVLEFKPIALEGIDQRLYENIQKKGGRHAEHLSLLPEGRGWLVVQFGSASQKDSKDVAEKLCGKLGRQPGAPNIRLLVDKTEKANLWDVREAGLGATALCPAKRIHGRDGKIRPSRRKRWGNTSAICASHRRIYGLTSLRIDS